MIATINHKAIGIYIGERTIHHDQLIYPNAFNTINVIPSNVHAGNVTLICFSLLLGFVLKDFGTLIFALRDFVNYILQHLFRAFTKNGIWAIE